MWNNVPFNKKQIYILRQYSYSTTKMAGEVVKIKEMWLFVGSSFFLGNLGTHPGQVLCNRLWLSRVRKLNF